MSARESLLDLLEARHGIVCAVGAGGKKSLLRHLAGAHPGRVALTGTVFIAHFQPREGFTVVIAPDAELPAAVARVDAASSVAYACPSDKPARHAGVAAATVERIHREGRFAATYVKADGARMRWLKVPADGEPVLPAGCTTLVPVVSALVIGEPLSERVAHRVERVESVTGLRAGDPITAAHVGRLLASPHGGLKLAAGRQVVPLINMVDDPAREAAAREAAAVALELTSRIDRVVLTCLGRAGDPVVAVVRR